MASVESSIITALKSALILSGYKVFDNVLDRHTGYATKSGTYVMIDNCITVDWEESSYETIGGDFSLRMRYYQGVSKVSNSSGQMVTTSTACYELERAISQVKVGTMHTRFNIRPEETTASNLRGFTRDYVLHGTLTACQDRSEF